MATKAVKLPSGSWRVRVQIDSDDGARHYKSFTAPTRKEAEFMAAQYAYAEKETRKPRSMTVGDAIDSYIDARSAVLSPATVRVYKQTRRCYFALIEKKKLGDLHSEDVQKQVNALASLTSPKTVRNAYALLTSTLRAYHPDLALRVILPKRIKTEIDVPEKDDVSRLLEAAQETELENAILLAAGYGMRRGEICALLYSDLDESANTVSVTKSLAKNDANEWVIKAPKSYAGTRTFGVSPNLIDRLKHNRHDAQRVCPLHPDLLTRRFMRLCDAVGVKCRFHDLRHYNASIMLSLNVPDKYAMERLGQSTPGLIKAVYQHIMTDKRDEVTQTVNTALETLIG